MSELPSKIILSYPVAAAVLLTLPSAVRRTKSKPIPSQELDLLFRLVCQVKFRQPRAPSATGGLL